MVPRQGKHALSKTGPSVLFLLAVKISPATWAGGPGTTGKKKAAFACSSIKERND
jgi:hypothetical protein